GDNGECQFRHACTKDDGIEHLYLVRRKTATYRQLVADGYKDKLLRPKSRAAIEAILRAEYVFLTHHPRWEYLGLSRRSWEYLANLVSARTVTAFHGLVIPALTNVARTSDNAELVFLASDFERRNLLAERYQFAEHQLKLTGHPRFDALRPDRAGFVLIAPTWRRDTVTGHGRRHEYPDFYSSEYYGIYNELLSDGKWLGSLMSLGYSVKFLLHPVMSESMDHFGPYPGVDIIPGRAADYIELMSTADAMVTDYSGIGFDFAYTGKPLFYFQPPELPEHYAKSPVFDYERDGFGPVLATSNALKTALLTAAKDRFPQPEGYQARVEHFFAHRDHNNAERIYQTMLDSTNCAGGRPPCNPRA
ncbi:MAG: CDP-glycerol glycerophosphotransferase family protein, partial [Propionibacteriaceae bacterium]|nr:CDP-glycerol glycerophosphotransferase family protein [Propionibacteriaceae bacterium]